MPTVYRKGGVLTRWGIRVAGCFMPPANASAVVTVFCVFKRGVGFAV